MKKISLSILLLAGFMSLMAQDNGTTTSTFRSFSPDDQLELGIHLGTAGVVGDLDFKPGFGGGLHLRKSLDHIFSLRLVALYAKTSGDDGTRTAREYDLNWLSGSIQTLITFNNLRFNRPYRRVLIYGLVGAGVQNFKTDFRNIPGRADAEISETGAQLEGGAGISFRINKKMNFSLEETAMFAFGKGADELDGDRNNDIPYTTYRDVLHYPHLSLNFNIGGKSKSGGMKVEPLYWVNPMMAFSEAVASLEARPIYDPTDTDKDGVIDAVDQEKDSPADARVDSRGVTLDSDSDGLADYKDKEPYSPPGYKVDAMGVANVPKEKIFSEKEINDMIATQIKGIKFPSAKGLSDWFLPMIHFDLDRYNIKQGEYDKLFHVASVLKQNPDIRVAVLGYTDKSSSDRYNNVLSYNRAKAAIDFLVAQHGISRDRLVLTWGGEEKTLVPTNRANYLNRRVEFKVATTETEMGRPDGPNAGRGGKIGGNKDAGY